MLIEVVAPNASAARQILRSYIDDVASRYHGRRATDEEIDASVREDPNIDLAPPSGVFLIARQRGAVLGCAGMRLLSERVGEVKRLFVAPAARGRGLGAHLMGELESIARGHGRSVLRLDTSHDLVESRRLMPPSATRRYPPSTTAGTPSTGWQSPWPSGRRRQGCTPIADRWVLAVIEGSPPPRTLGTATGSATATRTAWVAAFGLSAIAPKESPSEALRGTAPGRPVSVVQVTT